MHPSEGKLVGAAVTPVSCAAGHGADCNKKLPTCMCTGHCFAWRGDTHLHTADHVILLQDTQQPSGCQPKLDPPKITMAASDYVEPAEDLQARLTAALNGAGLEAAKARATEGMSDDRVRTVAGPCAARLACFVAPST